MNPFQEWHDYDVKVAHEEGIDTGRSEERLARNVDFVRRMMSNGSSMDEAFDFLELTESDREAVASALNR